MRLQPQKHIGYPLAYINKLESETKLPDRDDMGKINGMLRGCCTAIHLNSCVRPRSSWRRPGTG